MPFFSFPDLLLSDLLFQHRPDRTGDGRTEEKHGFMIDRPGTEIRKRNFQRLRKTDKRETLHPERQRLALLIVPGIIKAYSYAMTPYILVDRPELSVRDAIRLSGRMMSGRKLDLFCLHLSFIGWMLLCILTLGIGILFLSPYMMTAQAAFYQDVRSDYEMKTAEAGL